MGMQHAIKHYVWKAGIRAAAVLPATWRQRLQRMLCEATADTYPPHAALREVLRTADMVGEYLDAAALRYEGGIHPKHRLMKYHAFFTQHLSKQNTVLDVGCGYGAVAYSMAVAGATVTGIDMDETNIRHARERYRHPRCTFCVGCVPETLPEGNFDTVVLSNVLEHIDRRQPFLARLQEVLHPQQWLIRVPMINREWTVPLRQELGLFAYSDPTHQTEYTEQTFRKEMQSAGLSIQEMQINWGEIWAVCVSAPAVGAVSA